MKCLDVRAELTAYLANEVGQEARVALDTHLAGCPPCWDELEALRETWGALGGLPAPRPSPDLEGRILARATVEGGRLRARRLLRPLRVPLAALLAALLSIGLSTLVPYEAAARLCRDALEGLPLASGLAEAAGAFLVGLLYAALPVLLIALLIARLNGHRPLAQGGSTAALFVLVLTPYALAACSGLPAAFVTSLLGGLTVGAFAGGPGGFWLGRRETPVTASA